MGLPRELMSGVKVCCRPVMCDKLHVMLLMRSYVFESEATVTGNNGVVIHGSKDRPGQGKPRSRIVPSAEVDVRTPWPNEKMATALHSRKHFFLITSELHDGEPAPDHEVDGLGHGTIELIDPDSRSHLDDPNPRHTDHTSLKWASVLLTVLWGWYEVVSSTIAGKESSSIVFSRRSSGLMMLDPQRTHDSSDIVVAMPCQDDRTPDEAKLYILHIHKAVRYGLLVRPAILPFAGIPILSVPQQSSPGARWNGSAAPMAEDIDMDIGPTTLVALASYAFYMLDPQLLRLCLNFRCSSRRRYQTMHSIGLILPFLAFVESAFGQLGQSNATAGAFTDILLCNQTFADANGTGVFTVNPNVDQGTQTDQPDNDTGKTRPVDLAVTLVEEPNTSRLQLTTWLNPRGANYSDDFGLGYDVCGMAIGPFPNNTLYRAQSDNGSCYSVLDETCVNDIKILAQQFALELTLNPTPYPNSNLTVDSISTVCSDIAANLMIQQLAMLLVSIPIAALTGYNSSILYANCYTNVSHNDAYYAIETSFVDYNDANYNLLGRIAAPILAIWMPIANAERPSTIQYATAELICAGVKKFNPGSRVAASLPSPTPVGSGGGLAGGAIAGIVVGVVVGVALIAALAVWWLVSQRRRARSNAAVEVTPPEKGTSDYSSTGAGPPGDVKVNEQMSPTEAPDTALSELPPSTSTRSELDTGKGVERFELPSEASKPVELPGSGAAVRN
ncbi:uncharacterized protein MYCFIDRAFT_178616 [Pseudocercospora fijiensis CIRAD86]|uniref:Uncharacterized protein n=1 Tax=Pseudocercospora fijiensis (strain CIRAD86) TaxID=383855 RepID=M2YL58_PSEFD|nr:uncharacterized protein MYCFIDRAFT_178616 [Pseudocercospora fijiensis CIRAD86]EME78470.1 hypothetical protein MYCFIDRAFT_178616 [Pseudocercospora fijiensis CIRAD86]